MIMHHCATQQTQVQHAGCSQSSANSSTNSANSSATALVAVKAQQTQAQTHQTQVQQRWWQPKHSKRKHKLSKLKCKLTKPESNLARSSANSYLNICKLDLDIFLHIFGYIYRRNNKNIFKGTAKKTKTNSLSIVLSCVM